MEVFVVEYQSDPENMLIKGVFSSEERAKGRIAQLAPDVDSSRWLSIRRFTLDEPAADLRCWTVEVNESGECIACRSYPLHLSEHMIPIWRMRDDGRIVLRYSTPAATEEEAKAAAVVFAKDLKRTRGWATPAGFKAFSEQRGVYGWRTIRNISIKQYNEAVPYVTFESQDGGTVPDDAIEQLAADLKEVLGADAVTVAARCEATEYAQDDTRTEGVLRFLDEVVKELEVTK